MLLAPYDTDITEPEAIFTTPCDIEKLSSFEATPKFLYIANGGVERARDFIRAQRITTSGRSIRTSRIDGDTLEPWLSERNSQNVRKHKPKNRVE